MNAEATPIDICNIEAEQSLLGAILVDNRAFERVMLILEAKHFFEPLHRDIFDLIGKSIAAGKSVNPITLKPLFAGITIPSSDGEDMPVGQYLVRMASEAVSVVMARSMAEAVYEMWQRRNLLETCAEVSDRCRDLDPSADILDAVSDIEDKLAVIKSSRIEQENATGATGDWMKNLGDAAQNKDPIGVPIKHREIQKVLSEPTFRPCNLYGCLASSGEGKTSCVLELMSHAMKMGHPTLFLSYDQSLEQCIGQMAAQELSIEHWRQLEGKLSDKEFGWCFDFDVKVKSMPFEVIECGKEKAERLITLARSFIRRYGNGKTPFIVIDHIKAIPVDDRRADAGTQATDITRVLKNGAGELDAAVLILNQRNGSGIRRDIPQPIMADLYGGEIARTDYDAIFYLYRYKKWFDEKKGIATEYDQKKLQWAFKYYLSQAPYDITKIGALKVRFGDASIFKHMEFEGQFTRYKSYVPLTENHEAQEALNI